MGGGVGEPARANGVGLMYNFGEMPLRGAAAFGADAGSRDDVADVDRAEAVGLAHSLSRGFNSALRPRTILPEGSASLYPP